MIWASWRCFRYNRKCLYLCIYNPQITVSPTSSFSASFNGNRVKNHPIPWTCPLSKLQRGAYQITAVYFLCSLFVRTQFHWQEGILMFQGHNSKEMSQRCGGVHVAIHITSSRVELMFPASCPKVMVMVSNEVKPHLTTVLSPPCFPPSNQALDLRLYALECHKIKQPPTPNWKTTNSFVFFSTLIHAKPQMKHTKQNKQTAFNHN